MSSFNIKANRTFTFIRKWAWIFTLLVALGGLYYPRLGILVLPIMLSLTIVSFFKGRYWCGNLCPHGSLYDTVLLKYSKNKKIPKFFRSKILGILFFSWFGFNIIRKLIKVSSIYGTAPFLDKLGFIFVASYLMVLIIGVPLSVIFTPRTWCQFCPMGMLQTLSYKLGKLLGVAKVTDKKITIKCKDMCHNCGKCSRVCPMQLTPYLEFNNNNQFDNEKCIRCSTCIANCPAKILSLSSKKESCNIINKTDITSCEDRKNIKAKIVNIKELTDNIIEYTFEFVSPDKVSYKAGQYILINIQDNPYTNRAYSISSFNEDDSMLSITVKNVEDGYGTQLMYKNFKIGHCIELQGPMGNELVVDKTAEKILLLATGIGITPFLSIVNDIIKSPKNIKNVKLVYGASYEKDFIYDNELTKLSQSAEIFEHIKVSSRDKSFKGPHGRITDIVRDIDLTDYKIYICGSSPVVTDTINFLCDLGANRINIFAEGN